MLFIFYVILSQYITQSGLGENTLCPKHCLLEDEQFISKLVGIRLIDIPTYIYIYICVCVCVCVCVCLCVA